MLLLISFIVLCYAFCIIAFTYGWINQKEHIIKANDIECNSFSVVIPLRNESENLPNLLNGLNNIIFPAEKYEIIFIDDDSDDYSYSIISDFITYNKLDWKLESTKGGKKQAVFCGINIAKNKYVLSVDADCQIPRNILHAYNQKLQNGKLKMIAGPVSFSSDSSFVGKLMELEFVSLIASGAGAVGVNNPIMINAANFVVERQAALKAKDDVYSSKVASGDDVFLMHHLIKKYESKSIGFLKSKDAIVYTPAPVSVAEWLKQRLRWTSKSKYYGINATSITAIIILGYNLSILISLIAIAFSAECYIYFLALFLTKIIIDFPLLLMASKFFSKSGIMKYLFVMELIYPFYIVGVGILGNIIKVKWKGREVK